MKNIHNEGKIIGFIGFDNREHNFSNEETRYCYIYVSQDSYYQQLQEYAKNCSSVGTLAQEISNFMSENFPSTTILYRRYIFDSLNKVDFQEVAQALLEDNQRGKTKL